MSSHRRRTGRACARRGARDRPWRDGRSSAMPQGRGAAPSPAACRSCGGEGETRPRASTPAGWICRPASEPRRSGAGACRGRSALTARAARVGPAHWRAGTVNSGRLISISEVSRGSASAPWSAWKAPRQSPCMLKRLKPSSAIASTAARVSPVLSVKAWVKTRSLPGGPTLSPSPAKSKRKEAMPAWARRRASTMCCRAAPKLGSRPPLGISTMSSVLPRSGRHRMPNSRPSGPNFSGVSSSRAAGGQRRRG